MHRLLSFDEISETQRKLYENAIVTTEEAMELFRFYHSNIPKICEIYDFPITTQLLAHVLLSKYSICHSVLTHDMKHVMLTCCYFAAKLDNVRLAFSDFCGKIKNVNPQTIEAIEFVLLEMIDFQPWVFSAYPAALGIALDAGLLNNINQEELEKRLAYVYQTDIPLMFSETQIALHVLSKMYSAEIIAKYTNDFDLNSIQQYLITEPINKERLKDVDRRILQSRKYNVKNE